MNINPSQPPCVPEEFEVLTDKKLLEILESNYDDKIMKYYHQRALNNTISFASSDSLIKFLLLLVRYYDDKLFCKKAVDPLDFFGLRNFQAESEYRQYTELLTRTHYEVIQCIDNGIYIPEPVIADFYARYAHAMFCLGNHLQSLEYCQKALKHDPSESLSKFIKACVIEYCYICNSNDISKIALTNYQKELLSQCDPQKLFIGERLYKEVSNIVEQKRKHFSEISKCIFFELALKSYEETKAVYPNWTEEKDFYLRNNLFLNPLNVFDEFIIAQNEEFDTLKIDQTSKRYFDDILADYAQCRHSLFEYIKGASSTKREMAITYCYIYSIFDKIAYLLWTFYHLDIEERNVYFKSELFSSKIKGKNMKFGDIKNDNILPLFMIMNDLHETRTIDSKNILYTAVFELKPVRNKIMHRSLSLVEDEKLKRNSFTLLKLARAAILHTFMLIHSCPLDKATNLITTIGTTHYQAIVNIAQQDNHTDLSK